MNRSLGCWGVQRHMCTDAERMQGRAAVYLEELHPEIAVILALAAHPAFPRHATSGLPTMCEILQQAVATDAQDTLSAVLAAMWAVCWNCSTKLTFSDASSLCTALLGALPRPPQQSDTRDAWADPTAGAIASMVAAVACVLVVLRGARASTSAWQRLHAAVLGRLSSGLSALSHDALCSSFSVGDLFGGIGSSQSDPGVARAGSQSFAPDDVVSLLSLAAAIAAHIVHTQGDGLLRGSHHAAPQAVAVATGAEAGCERPVGHRADAPAVLGTIIASFCGDIILPAHVAACAHGAGGGSGAAVHAGLHAAVCVAIIMFLETALTKTHGVYLLSGACADRADGAGVDDMVPGAQYGHGRPSEHQRHDHPVVTAAVLLGWRCISCGFLVLLVERCVQRAPAFEFLANFGRGMCCAVRSDTAAVAGTTWRTVPPTACWRCCWRQLSPDTCHTAARSSAPLRCTSAPIAIAAHRMR